MEVGFGQSGDEDEGMETLKDEQIVAPDDEDIGGVDMDHSALLQYASFFVFWYVEGTIAKTYMFVPGYRNTQKARCGTRLQRPEGSASKELQERARQLLGRI